MAYNAFDKQSEFHNSKARLRAAVAGKRGGKTESGAVECIKFTCEQIGYKPNGIDPYLGVIIAPTNDMLRRLSLKKFFAYADKHFDYDYHKTMHEIKWYNGSEIYGISAEKPNRLEGVKANWIWIDEVFQVSEHLFLECLARISDTQGYLWVTGSLGVQYNNPKLHWVYKYFKEKPIPNSAIFEWPTAANPHFPKEELELYRETLDPKTYRQLFELDWDVTPENVVYECFDKGNILEDYVYDPGKETVVAIDWGWAHEMACLFFQYDRKTDTVVLFDEIVSSKMTLQQLWVKIRMKNYRIDHWVCDIAGNQEREQTGRSNVGWFREKLKINFKYKAKAVNYGIAVVRQYIQNGLGQKRFHIVRKKCPKSIEGMNNYSYQQKDGIIINENPIKKNDDCVDAIRYYFVNMRDKGLIDQEFKQANRWSEKWQFS